MASTEMSELSECIPEQTALDFYGRPPRAQALDYDKAQEKILQQVMDNVQNDIKDGMIQLESGKVISVVKNCAKLEDPKKTRNLSVSFLRRKIDEGVKMLWCARD
ncbi:hypothetical protein PoB_005569900 [Plakobranchus ocellatus]|uniref:Uncharacterized protein n=1 Tax=Plakobranchus ocellatus TaxID=259542 RepID=A0AAV4C9C9_9GAST|nr:hypothetical protein PoB_005569900 [Plakobranchus ocellatus]